MKRLLAFAVLGFIGLVGVPAHAQTMSAIVVGTCGTPPTTYSAGQPFPLTQDTTGTLCAQGGGGSSTITANSTATSGFTAGQLIYSDGSKVQAAAVTVDGSGNMKANSLAIGGATLGTNEPFALNYSPGANTSTPGLSIINPNAASSGNQQYAGLALSGYGWKTTATAASQEVDWKVTDTPIQGSSAPTGSLVFSEQINGGGYNNYVSIGTTNDVGITGSVNISGTTSGSFTGDNGALFMFQGQVQLGISGPNVAAGVSFTESFGFAAGAWAAYDICDACFTRKGPANIQFGLADVASPIAQAISFQSVIAGTSNASGANATIVGSLGTGTGVGGDIIFDVAKAGSSGSTQNSKTEAFRIAADSALPKWPSSSTGAGTETFTNSPCTGLTTEQWIPVEITGQTGTWYVPACQ